MLTITKLGYACVRVPLWDLHHSCDMSHGGSVEIFTSQGAYLRGRTPKCARAKKSALVRASGNPILFTYNYMRMWLIMPQ